jgi:TRAP-type C4-dicarboxylate transport system substrate-binding protein
LSHSHSRSGFAIVLALGLFLAPVGAAAGPQPKVRLKMATLAPEGSTWMELMHEFDARVREATDNEVGFKFYPGGVQGDEKLVLRKIRQGQLHGGGFTGTGLGAIASELRVLEVPFLLASDAELDAVHEEFDAEFAAALERVGYVLLGWAEVGFVHLFTKKPVRDLDDLRASKMWLWEGDPLAERLFSVAGVTPVSLAITDAYTSLQTGLVDGVYSSPYACVVLQWHTLVKAMSATPLTHAIGAVIVTRERFAKVSPQSRRKIHEIAADVFVRLRASSREENRRAVRDIEAAGIEIVPFDDEALREFRIIGDKAAEECVGELFSADLYARVRQKVLSVRAAAAGGPGEGR